MHFIVLMMSIFLLIGIIRGILRIKDTKTSLKNYTDKLKGNIVREFSDIDIIIPVYNEQKIIKQSINRKRCTCYIRYDSKRREFSYD